jgi:hypothetical protein
VSSIVKSALIVIDSSFLVLVPGRSASWEGGRQHLNEEPETMEKLPDIVTGNVLTSYHAKDTQTCSTPSDTL